MEKLEHANQVVTDLENVNNGEVNNGEVNDQDTICKRWSKYIPKYTMIRVIRETPTVIFLLLVFDKKDTINGIRQTGTYSFSCPNPIVENDAGKSVIHLALQHLGNKLREKYGVDILHD